MPTFEGYEGREWPDPTQRGNYVPNYGPNRGQARSPSLGYRQGFSYQRQNYSPSAGTQRQGYSPNSANPQGYGYQNQRPGMFKWEQINSEPEPWYKAPGCPSTSCTLPCTRQATFKLQLTKQVGDQCLVSPEMSRCHNVLEINLPSHRNLTATVVTSFNGHSTEDVIDSAAIVTLVQENPFSRIFCLKDFGPVCVLTGIGEEPVHGQLVHNFPINAGSQTFLYTVCVAPIKDKYLLRLDFLTATGCKLDPRMS